MRPLGMRIAVGWAKRSAGPPPPATPAHHENSATPGRQARRRPAMGTRRFPWRWWAGAPLGPPYANHLEEDCHGIYDRSTRATRSDSRPAPRKDLGDRGARYWKIRELIPNSRPLRAND